MGAGVDGFAKGPDGAIETSTLDIYTRVEK